MGVDNVNEIRKDSQGREIKSNRAWREECERLRLAVDLLTIELEATRAERDAAINKGMAKIEGTRWLNHVIEPSGTNRKVPIDFNSKLGYKVTMNKEVKMTVNRIDTNRIWNELEVHGKTTVRNVFVRLDDFIAQLYDEARDYGVSLSIKRSTSPYHNGRIYVYLRKNCG